MKIRNALLIGFLSFGAQAFGAIEETRVDLKIVEKDGTIKLEEFNWPNIASNFAKDPIMQAKGELINALLVTNDYDKAASILKQYPALAKNIEFAVRDGASTNVDPLRSVVSFLMVSDEKINQIPDMVNLLLDLGADAKKIYVGVDPKKAHEKTILHIFAAENMIATEQDKKVAAAILDLLLARGADINAKNYEGNTPLMVACKDSLQRKLDIVKLLVKKGGADLTMVNNQGKTALQILQTKYEEWSKLKKLSSDELDAMSYDQELDAIKSAIDYLESRTPKAKK